MEGETLRLTGLVYDTAMGTMEWTRLLEEIAASMGAHSSILRLVDYEQRLVGIFESVGMYQEYKLAYQKHFIHIDPYQAALESFPTGKLMATTQSLPMAVLRKTEFFNDYALPQDKIFIGGGVLARNRNSQLQFGVHRGRAAGDFEQKDLALLSRLGPHLVRAVEIRRLMNEASFRQGLSEAALEQLRVGIIFSDGCGKPFYCNRAAEKLMALGNGLALGHDGLTLSAPSDTARLRNMVAAAARTAAGLAGGTMRVPTTNGANAFQLWVAPLARGHLPQDFFAPAACAAVFVSLPGRLNLPWREAAAYHGLTPAEAKLSVALAGNLSVEEAAGQLAISIHTARTHLKSIFAKTNTRRQPELVSLLLTSLFTLCRQGYESDGAVSSP